MSLRRLLALQASDGATVTLERYPIVLGRSLPGSPVPDVDVSHLDPGEAVDSRHCELNPEPKGLEVHDLGAIGGTWVDGRRLPPRGRALLELGGTLRVASVTMTLVEAANQPLAPLPARPAAPPPPSWTESGPADAVPPPPSAGSWTAEEEESREAEPVALALDLTGAPVLARDPIDGGAVAVRFHPGAPLESLSSGVWTQLGPQLTEATVNDALSTARRALGLSDAALVGAGYAGDVALEFMAPPFADRPHLLVRVEPRVVAELEGEEMEQAARTVAGGGTVLVAGPRPDLALAALAARIDREPWGTSALSFGSSDWWVPAGWGRFDSQNTIAIQAALAGSQLFLEQPPGPILSQLLSLLPRPGGGTVLGIRSRSLTGALEQLARHVDRSPRTRTEPGQREETASLVGICLAWQGSGWRAVRLGIDPEGRWLAQPLASRADRG